MQKLLISLMVLALSVPVMAEARSYGGGHYAGGHGSSHKAATTKIVQRMIITVNVIE
jgi:hypothetical protein